MPIVNIKPLLYLPIKKDSIVHFGIGKTMISLFNLVHAFFFIPFSIVLVVKGHHPIINVLGWHVAMFALIYSNNFINIFVNSKDVVFYSVVAIIITLGALFYFDVFDITTFTAPVFQSFYDKPYLTLIPLITAVVLYKLAFNYFKSNFYLDAGLAKKVDVGKTDNMSWLDRFGSVSKFLKKRY